MVGLSPHSGQLGSRGIRTSRNSMLKLSKSISRFTSGSPRSRMSLMVSTASIVPMTPHIAPSTPASAQLGAMCGVIGTIQAVETIKLILDLGDPLVNRLMLFDSLSMEFREVKIPRDPACPLCGDNPTIHELIDYEAFCGAPVTT